MNYSPTDRRQRENEGVGGILSSSMGFAQINAPANFNAASAMKHYLPMF